MYKKIVLPLFCLCLSTWFCNLAKGQSLITLEKAMEIAGQNSPEIQISLLNLTRYKESLNATKASQKSKFQLGVTPLDYSNMRKFDDYS